MDPVADSSPKHFFYQSNSTADVGLHHPKAEMEYNEGVYKAAVVLEEKISLKRKKNKLFFYSIIPSLGVTPFYMERSS